MATFNFITVRLGKDSVPDIQKICLSEVGVLGKTFSINVKCTQVPDNYGNNDYAFLWLGSDNNKGIPTQWKQGFKAVGRVKSVIRGKKYNDTSETKIEIVYIFQDSVNRMDILRCAPIAYYWCSSMPLIGLDDHANQTIRNMSGTSFSDLRAFFSAIDLVTKRFKNDIIQIEPDFAKFFNFILPNPQTYPLAKNVDDIDLFKPVSIDTISYYRFIYALRTKPFLLLAGISGTGKSQKVQELAFMTCPDGELRNEGGTTPGNYCLVEVKPNWHDSTELLGYYSALSGKYELTDFIRFAYKASQNKDVPFFLCLDEMNLAPVEQYFAEFLSVLETRKKVGDEILTQYLLSKERFSNCELQKKILVKDEGDIIEGDKQYKMEFLYSEKDSEIITYLKENGLMLPDNLFVIGTVNMDDTTHQFSRKVIDRAFTIEMNGGKMSEMFSPESKMLLEYRDEPIPLEAFKAEFVRSYEVLDDVRFAKYKDVISTRIPELLGDSDGSAEADSINGIFNETPFRVSYRVQNELVLYLSTLIERANFPELDQIEGLIGEATLAILLEKVLPRVQGEQKQLETQKGKSNVLKDLKTFVERHFKPENDADANSLYSQVLRKLKEMDDKLANYYTNFF